MLLDGGLSTLIKRNYEGPTLSGLLALGSQILQIKPQRLALSSQVQAVSGWVSRGGRTPSLSSAGGCQRQDLAFQGPCLAGADEAL